MKAGLYVRVSTEEQAIKGYSVPEQIDACKKKAQELGATDYILFCEEGESGAYIDRPELERLIAAVQAGDIQLVVALDTDRLARDLGSQIVIANEIEQHAKLDFVFYSRGDPENPEDNLFFHIKGAFAQYERAKIKRNTTGGRKRKAMSGKIVIPGGWSGHPGPYGYKYINDDKGPRLEIIESEAKIVRYIFDLAYTEGYGILRIVDRLNQENIPSPKGGHWHGSTVGRILKSETYAGTFYNYKYRTHMSNKRTSSGRRQLLYELRPLEERIPVSVPAIVERHVWKEVQKNLKRNALNNRKAGRFFLLKGRVKCGLCGRTCAAETSGLPSAKSKTRRAYYRCKGTKTGAYPKCTLPAIPSNTTSSERQGLDDIVWAEIVKTINHPELIQEYLNEAEQAISVNNINSQINKLKPRLAELAKQKDELFNLRIEGLLTAEELKKRLIKLDNKKRELEGQLNDLQEKLAAINSNRIDPVEFCEYFQKRIQTSSDEIKSQIIHDLDIEIIAYPGNYVICWPFAEITIKETLKPEPLIGSRPLSMTPKIREALYRYCEQNGDEVSSVIRQAIREAPIGRTIPKMVRQKRHRRTICLTETEIKKVAQIKGTYQLSSAYAIEWALETFLKEKGIL
jgi:site-specific DNA recombinase